MNQPIRIKPESRPPNGSRIPPAELGKKVNTQVFRQYLRQTDKFILDGQFDQAWLQLAEAAKLEPEHPMLIAFKERLELAQKKIASDAEIARQAAQAEGAGSYSGDGHSGTVSGMDAASSGGGPGGNPAAQGQEVAQREADPRAELESLRQELEAAREKGVTLERALAEQLEAGQALKNRCDAQETDEAGRLDAAVTAAVAVAVEAERKRYEEERAKVAEAQQKELEQLRVRMQSEADQIRAKLQSEFDQTGAQLQSQFDQKSAEETGRIAQEFEKKMELLGMKLPTVKEERLVLYRTKIRPYYGGGQPSADDEKSLVRLQELFQLTTEEHLAIASKLRLELYVERVEQRIRTGELNLANASALEDLKRQFCITPEESSRLEPLIFSAFQQLAMKGRILLVDDDQLVLSSVGKILSEHGFHVAQAADIASAMEQLEKVPIDMIVSDIKFANGELEGFKFFEAVAEQPRLSGIPFVFMSGLKDSFIVRSGAKLGVDDYLTKPVEPDLLIATIEGKLKRFSQFRPAPARS